MVRRGVLVRVGMVEAAALAAEQSFRPREICHGAGTLRHGGGDVVRDYRPGGVAAQCVCDGAQVDVERALGWATARGLPGRDRSSAGGGPGEDCRAVSDVGETGRTSERRVGGEAWIEGRDTDSDGSVRR